MTIKLKEEFDNFLYTGNFRVFEERIKENNIPYLSDEQCNEFRRLPLSFNDMLRVLEDISKVGMQKMTIDKAIIVVEEAKE
jgi:hypothetical protein